MIIEKLTPEYISSFCELAKEYIEEVNYSKLEFDRDHLYRTAFGAVLDSEQSLIIGRKDDKVVAAIWDVVVTPVFSQQPYIDNLYLYISKDHRGGLGASRLIKKAREWANSKGSAYHQIGVFSGIATGRTEQLYSKLGYDKVGSYFISETGE